MGQVGRGWSRGRYKAPGTRVSLAGSSASLIQGTPSITLPSTSFGFDPVANGLSLIGETGFGNFSGSGQVSNAEGFLTTDFGTAAFNATRGDAPISPSGTFETRYPGNDAGNGTGGSRMWCNGEGSKQLYFRMWVFLPSNYAMHTGGEKFFYPVWNTGASIIGWRPVSEGDANGTNWKFEYGPQSSGGIQVWEQAAGPYPNKNQWNLLEVYLRLNTGGANDGEIRTWVNGSLVDSRTDVRWSDNANPALDLGGFRWDGTRGGGASSVLTPAGGQSRFYDHVAAYGSPDRVSPTLTTTPNRPGGLTTLTEINASQAVPTVGANGTITAVTGQPWYYYKSQSTGLTVQSRTNAIKSPNSVYAIAHPTGMGAGADPAGQFGFFPSAAQNTWYEAGWWRVGTGSDYECHGVGVKALGFWGMNGDGPDNQFYAFLDGTGSNAVVTSMPIRFAQQNTISRGLSANENVGSAVIQAGRWYRYEILMGINTVGSANGTFQFWLDGVRVFNYTDMVWRNSSFPQAFFGRKIDCTWGGSSALPAKTRDDFIEFDHIIVAGA